MMMVVWELLWVVVNLVVWEAGVVVVGGGVWWCFGVVLFDGVWKVVWKGGGVFVMWEG